MGMAELVVTAVVFEGRSKSEVARDYNLSRRWVITLVQRYLAEGDGGLAPRSRRPHHSPKRTPQALEDEIVEIRKELSHAGHEAGAGTIGAHLERRHGASPAISTIWRILTERGFVTPSPTSGPRARSSASRPTSPTSAGRPTSRIGPCGAAPTSRSSTSSTTIRGSALPRWQPRCSRPSTWTAGSEALLRPTAGRPAC